MIAATEGEGAADGERRTGDGKKAGGKLHVDVLVSTAKLCTDLGGVDWLIQL